MGNYLISAESDPIWVTSFYKAFINTMESAKQPKSNIHNVQILLASCFLNFALRMLRFFPLYCIQFLNKIISDAIINNVHVLLEDIVITFICLRNTARTIPDKSNNKICSAEM